MTSNFHVVPNHNTTGKSNRFRFLRVTFFKRGVRQNSQDANKTNCSRFSPACFSKKQSPQFSAKCIFDSKVKSLFSAQHESKRRKTRPLERCAEVAALWSASFYKQEVNEITRKFGIGKDQTSAT